MGRYNFAIPSSIRKVYLTMINNKQQTNEILLCDDVLKEYRSRTVAERWRIGERAFSLI